MMPCGSELSPPLLRRPLTMVTCARWLRSGFEDRRELEIRAGLRRATSAASPRRAGSRRSPGAAWAPRRSAPARWRPGSSHPAAAARWRRRRPAAPCGGTDAFLVRNMAMSSTASHCGRGGAAARSSRRPASALLRNGIAGHDADHERREAVVVAWRRRARCARTVGMSCVVDGAAQRIGHQLLGERLHELVAGSPAAPCAGRRAIERCVPSGSSPAASMGVARVAIVASRHWPTASKFSSAKPSGSMHAVAGEAARVACDAAPSARASVSALLPAGVLLQRLDVRRRRRAAACRVMRRGSRRRAAPAPCGSDRR